jgi:tRNA dimethylallyltransferase
MTNKLIVVLGPTASGKTALSLKLAQLYHGEIISADSRQVYRGMDIGTEKVFGTNDEINGDPVVICNGIPHYLIDICAPDGIFTLADYQRNSFRVIQQIQSRQKLPFLVGGTGLYISAVVDNYVLPVGKPNLAMRKIWDQQSVETLAKELAMLDPNAALQVDTSNKRRLIRSLEVVHGKGDDEFLLADSLRKKGNPIFDVLQIGIDVPRSALYERIDERVDEQREKGIVSEVETLLKHYPAHLPAFSGIGYRQIIQHLNGGFSLEEAFRRIKRDTRRYAKRQLTWFRRDKRIHWVKDGEEAEEILQKILPF